MKSVWAAFGILACVTAATVLAVDFVWAQGPPPGQFPGQEGGMRGNFDPAQMRTLMLKRMQEELGATEEEWKVMEPRLTKVLELRRDMRPRGMGGPGRPGGPEGPGGPGPQSPEVEALQQVLANASASNDEVTAALQKLREARAKREQELKTAQEFLREVLTVRQEAQLVLMGTLN